MLRLMAFVWRVVARPRRPDRRVFRFDRGGVRYRRDPVLVRDRLNELRPDWPDLVAGLAKAGRPLPPGTSAEFVRRRNARLAEESRTLADLVAAAFGVPAFAPDGTGLTVEDRLTLFAEWVEWCNAVEREYLSFPTPPPCTASPGGG